MLRIFLATHPSCQKTTTSSDDASGTYTQKLTGTFTPLTDRTSCDTNGDSRHEVYSLLKRSDGTFDIIISELSGNNLTRPTFYSTHPTSSTSPAPTSTATDRSAQMRSRSPDGAASPRASRRSPSSGVADDIFSYGRAGDEVVVGDFDGDGDDEFAVRRDRIVRFSLTSGVADIFFAYGRLGDELITGNWDSLGGDTFAVIRTT